MWVARVPAMVLPVLLRSHLVRTNTLTFSSQHTYKLHVLVCHPSSMRLLRPCDLQTPLENCGFTNWMGRARWYEGVSKAWMGLVWKDMVVLESMAEKTRFMVWQADLKACFVTHDVCTLSLKFKKTVLKNTLLYSIVASYLRCDRSQSCRRPMKHIIHRNKNKAIHYSSKESRS